MQHICVLIVTGAIASLSSILILGLPVDAQTSYTYVLHLFSSAAYNTIASSTSPTNTTSNFGDFLDGFLSGTHLVVEVQHVLLRL